MKNELPVLLLTGYLGSGKTTLLNRILSNERGIKFAVIVNDIGEVNIDADLIQKGGVVDQKDDSLVALQNGCICCTLKMDLVEQIAEITAMQKFDYLVIEASGICEPQPIAQTICSVKGGNYKGFARADMYDHFGGSDVSTRTTSLFGGFDGGAPPQGQYLYQRNGMATVNGILRTDSFTTMKVNADYSYHRATHDISQSIHLGGILLGGCLTDYYNIIDRNYNLGSGYSVKSTTCLDFGHVGLFTLGFQHYKIFAVDTMSMSASSIKRKSTLLLSEAARSFIFRSATTFPGRKHLRENALLSFRFEMLIRK